MAGFLDVKTLDSEFLSLPLINTPHSCQWPWGLAVATAPVSGPHYSAQSNAAGSKPSPGSQGTHRGREGEKQKQLFFLPETMTISDSSRHLLQLMCLANWLSLLPTWAAFPPICGWYLEPCPSLGNWNVFSSLQWMNWAQLPNVNVPFRSWLNRSSRWLGNRSPLTSPGKLSSNFPI